MADRKPFALVRVSWTHFQDPYSSRYTRSLFTTSNVFTIALNKTVKYLEYLMPLHPASATKTNQGDLACVRAYVLITAIDSSCLFGEDLKKEHISLTVPIMFLIIGMSQECTMARFRQCALQYV